jgi:hypothetical protein
MVWKIFSNHGDKRAQAEKWLRDMVAECERIKRENASLHNQLIDLVRDRELELDAVEKDSK